MSTRYAVYFAPPPGSPWWHFGSRWLGRDAANGTASAHYKVPGFTVHALQELTAEPRRYGFHATLKPPFALVQGQSREALCAALSELAARHASFPLGPMRLERVGHFLALVADRPSQALASLADACVQGLDSFRAPSSEKDLSRRRAAGLTRRQEAMLVRWGYPYVLREWRFHMTLTGKLTDQECLRLTPWLGARIEALSGHPLQVAALSLFEQDSATSEFRLTNRIPLSGPSPTAPAGEFAGRLFYVVGASGSGKDSLIRYARQRLALRPIVFARRFITRPAQADAESHFPVSDRDFQRQLRSGGFAMHWFSHGYMYGIGIDMDLWLSRGRDVVVNGSREYLEQARKRYPKLIVIWVEAAEPLLRARLAARGRDANIEDRLKRAAQFTRPADAILISNEGSIHEAGNRLIGILSSCETNRPQSLDHATREGHAEATGTQTAARLLD